MCRKSSSNSKRGNGTLKIFSCVSQKFFSAGIMASLLSHIYNIYTVKIWIFKVQGIIVHIKPVIHMVSIDLKMSGIV